MKNKAISPVIAATLLIALSISLATIILTFGTDYVTNLSPPVNCDGINFEAEIMDQKLNVVNFGAIQIEGFTINLRTETTLKKIEEITNKVPPGETESIPLTKEYSESTYEIIPKIKIEDKIYICQVESKQTIKNTL